MRLRSVRIHGYKRFETPSVLYIYGPLVAIVGPNEAGKTSLLRAIEHCSTLASFGRRDFTGRQQPASENVIVSARYLVEGSDVAALDGLLDSKTTYKFYVERRAGETHLRSSLTPRLERDLSPRREAMTSVRRTADAGLLRREEPNADGKADLDLTYEERAIELATKVEESGQTLLEDVREGLRTFADELDEIFVHDRVIELGECLRDLATVEERQHPNSEARDRLIARLPRILFFGDEQRRLATNYEWVDHAEPTPALANVFALAETDFDDFRSVATDRERRDELQTLERRANRTLQKKFAAWTQEQLSLAFRSDHEGLQLQIYDHKTLTDVPFDERSAGLRSFVALIAFAARYGAGGSKPVLLVDEAETHLHYGGQADLIKVFERQRVAQSIIYTTHSIGCLPEDLGTTIRVVRPTDSERSVVENSFWSGGAGLTPLMVAMGAHALAFTPARLAVLTEGPSDAILLPALFREARPPRYSDEPLGFQVAPGVSNVHSDDAGQLEFEAGGVVYLIDADEGGRAHADKLHERAREEGRVVELGEEGLCVEDLVDGVTLVQAFNDTLAATRSTPERLSADALPAIARPTFWDVWCDERGIRRTSKTLIAQRVIELALDGSALLQPGRRKQVGGLYTKLRKRLAIPEPSSRS